MKDIELSELDKLFLVLTLPAPFVVLTLRFFPTYCLITLLPYLLTWILYPIYISARDVSVQKKASNILRYKELEGVNFTPEERDILKRALGKKRSKPLRPARRFHERHWKMIICIGIIILAGAIWTLPISSTESQYKHEIATFESKLNVSLAEIELSSPPILIKVSNMTQFIDLVKQQNASIVYVEQIDIPLGFLNYKKYLIFNEDYTLGYYYIIREQ